jgi:histidine ammonia-lyase
MSAPAAPPLPGPATIQVGAAPLRIEDLAAVALGGAPLELAPDPAFRARVEASAAFLARLLAEGAEVYGVNTGYGDSCTVRVPDHLVAELPVHLTRYHGCGLGRILDEDQTRAVLVARLTSLAQGHSAVRFELLEALAALLNRGVLPRIPSEGSVGASGDLTPLSYLVATLIGERKATFRGRVMEAPEALALAGLEPYVLAPKEALALMNGTAVMTGLGCLAFHRAAYLGRLASRLTALAAAALDSNRDHFHPRLFELKPHAGQQLAAARIFDDLGADVEARRLQDRYSIRCAPHVIGVLEDALPWIRRDLEHELNSANDNPLFDADLGRFFHGGHFYGGHVAFAMDALKVAVANLADLLDRQLALLVDSRYNQGLPQNLSGATGPRASINHGLKAAQISASALTAEALKQCMPASVFSRSTECHNQDKVSMGTIASRDCLRILELTERVAAILCVATRQALALRGPSGRGRLSAQALDFVADLEVRIPFIEEDRPLDDLLEDLALGIQAQAWRLYP